MPSKDRARKDKKKLNKCYYETNKDTLLLDRKEKYVKEDRSKHHRENYYMDVIASRTRSAERARKHYQKDVDKSRAESAESA